MTDFDPDAYLDQASSSAEHFDPDTHLDHTIAAGPSKAPYTGNSKIGALETGLHYATSAASLPFAAGASLYKLATSPAGRRASEAAKASQDVTQAMTYQPRTEAGKGMAASADDVLSVPAKAGDAAAMKIAEDGGSEGLAAVTDLGIQALPALFGVRGVRSLPGQFGRAVGTLGEQVRAAPRGFPQPVSAPPAAPVPAGTVAAAPPLSLEPGTLRAAPPAESAGTPAQPLSLAPGAGRTAPQPVPPAPPPAPLSTSGAPRAGYWQPSADPQTPPTFSESAPAAPTGTKLQAAEQVRRQAILERVGVPETRNSAIEGDAQAASNEYQESKLTSPNGARMKAVIDGERAALENHADRIVQETGGTPGSAVDESTRVERGNTIISPLDALKQHFDQATKELYQAADQRANGQPIDMPSVHKIIGGSASQFLGTVEGKQLLQGVKARMGDLGMLDDGEAQPANVQAAERLRQYLNDNWTPRTSRLIGSLKDAIDDDVTKSAGQDIYGQARAMRSLRARTLDDPNGIAKLMDSSGPEGVNRAVPTEKIADAVTTMPVAQLQHVLTTLKEVPDELQPQAQAAIAEIKAHMAAKVADAGKSTQSLWNAKGVTQTLTKNSARMQALFTPEEMAKFGDLNDAGNILKKDQSYPGAAVQEHNLVRSGAMHGIRTGATATGAAIGGPVGAAIGGFVGDKAATKLTERAMLKNAESRIRRLNP